MISAKATNRTALLILGMHRSGTSAVARVVNLLGAALGRDLLPPRGDNAQGFWENASIVNFHERLLGSMQLRWHDLLDSNHVTAARREILQCLPELGELIREQFGDAKLIAIKDPRLGLVAGAWCDCLRELGWRPAVVLVVRDPIEVASSLRDRDGFPSAKSNLLWLQSIIESEAQTRDVPRVFLSYSALLDDWRAAVDRVSVRLEIDWPCAQVGAAPIDGFLDRSLRHHRAEIDGPKPRHDLSGEIHRSLQHACESDGAFPMAFRGLSDLARGAIELAAPALLYAEQRLAAERRDYERQLTLARALVAEKDRELDHAKQGISRFEAEIAAAALASDCLQRQIEESRRGADDSERQLRTAREAIAILEKQIEDSRTAAANYERQLQEARESFSTLELQLWSTREARDALDVQLARSGLARADLESQIKHARQAAEDQAAQIERARQAAEDQAAQIERARQAVDDQAAQIERARQAVEDQAAQIERARQAVEDQAAQIERARQAAEDQAAQIVRARQLVEDQAVQIERARQAAEDQAVQIDLARQAADDQAQQVVQMRDELAQTRLTLQFAVSELEQLKADSARIQSLLDVVIPQRSPQGPIAAVAALVAELQLRRQSIGARLAMKLKRIFR